MTEFLMTFLLNAFWQTALIILAATIATRLLRDAGSRFKHVIWVAALLLSLTLPLLTSAWLNSPDVIADSGATPITYEVLEPVSDPVIVEAVADTPVTPSLPSTIPVSTTLAFVLLAIYALFVVYRAAALLNALHITSAIRRRAKSCELPASITAATRECSGLVNDRTIGILFSSEVPVPVTVGWRRPVIILPERFLRETDANVLTTAIAHEMVHIARRDYAVNLFLEAFSLPISFHPAVAYAKRRIAQMRELCCDEVVATKLLNADIYARSLLNIAGSATPADRLSPMITVGITDNRNLEVRIMSLLKRSEMSPIKKGLLALAALAVLAVPVVMAAYFAPVVTVTSAAVQPEAQPTVPEKVENEQVRAAREELEVELAAIKMRQQRPDLTEEERAKLGQRAKIIQEKLEALTKVSDDREPIERVEAKLEWLKVALKDPTVNDVDRAKIQHDIEILERELAERRLMETDQSMRRERLERQLVEVKTALADPNLPQEKRAIFAEMESKLERELERNNEDSIREKEERAFRERVDELAFRERVEKEKLARSANINGEQAIEIALAAHPGKLIEKGIGRINDEVVYRFTIRVAPATPERNAVFVVVSGVDGRIINTENVLVEETMRDGVKQRNLIIKKKPNDN